MNELITCEMTTGKEPERYELVPLAIESFLNQTYEPKQLLIVNDGEERINPEYENVREIYLEDSDHMLSELRNIVLDELEEPYIKVPWTDDDWKHPKLLEAQYKQMCENDVDAQFFQNQIQYSFPDNCAWRVENPHIPDSLMHRETDERYPERDVKKELGIGGDGIFRMRIQKSMDWNSWSNPHHHFLRFIHSFNVWDYDHFNIRPENTFEISSEEKEYLLEIVEKYRNRVGEWLWTK